MIFLFYIKDPAGKDYDDLRQEDEYEETCGWNSVGIVIGTGLQRSCLCRGTGNCS